MTKCIQENHILQKSNDFDKYFVTTISTKIRFNDDEFTNFVLIKNGKQSDICKVKRRSSNDRFVNLRRKTNKKLDKARKFVFEIS